MNENKTKSTFSIENLNPHPTEAIVLLYNKEEMDELDVSDTVYYLEEKFPQNKIIALPNTASLQSCSKDVLENIISMIAEIIASL